MAKKVKIIEKTPIKIIDKKVVHEETLEEAVDFEDSPNISTTGRKAFVLQERPATTAEVSTPITRAEPTRNTPAQTLGYEIQTDAASREGYLFRPTQGSYEAASRPGPTGAISGQRANPLVERPRSVVVDNSPLQNNQGLQTNNRVVGEQDRQYVQYEDNSDMRTKRRADWRL